jgi:hypothetical protein
MDVKIEDAFRFGFYFTLGGSIAAGLIYAAFSFISASPGFLLAVLGIVAFFFLIKYIDNREDKKINKQQQTELKPTEQPENI